MTIWKLAPPEIAQQRKRNIRIVRVPASRHGLVSCIRGVEVAKGVRHPGQARAYKRVKLRGIFPAIEILRLGSELSHVSPLSEIMFGMIQSGRGEVEDPLANRILHAALF